MKIEGRYRFDAHGDACAGEHAPQSPPCASRLISRRYDDNRVPAAALRVLAHVKNFVVRPGFALRMMQPNWQKRAMQFTDLPSGDLNMARYASADGLIVGSALKRDGLWSNPLDAARVKAMARAFERCEARV